MDTQNEPLARVSNEFLDYQYQVLGIGEHMHSSDVTEICINRPGEIYLETAREGWLKADVPTLTFERARHVDRPINLGCDPVEKQQVFSRVPESPGGHHPCFFSPRFGS